MRAGVALCVCVCVCIDVGTPRRLTARSPPSHHSSADPTADVEGHDVQAKIALLAKLAFGVHVPLDQIPTKGISSITR